MDRTEALEILNRDDEEMRKGYFCINDFLAIEKAKSDMQKLEKIEQIVKFNDFNYTEDCSGCPFEKEEDCLTCKDYRLWKIEQIVKSNNRYFVR